MSRRRTRWFGSKAYSTVIKVTGSALDQSSSAACAEATRAPAIRTIGNLISARASRRNVGNVYVRRERPAKAERLPERCADRRSIDGDQPGGARRPLEQHRSQLAADAASPIGRA